MGQPPEGRRLASCRQLSRSASPYSPAARVQRGSTARRLRGGAGQPTAGGHGREAQHAANSPDSCRHVRQRCSMHQPSPPSSASICSLVRRGRRRCCRCCRGGSHGRRSPCSSSATCQESERGSRSATAAAVGTQAYRERAAKQSEQLQGGAAGGARGGNAGSLYMQAACAPHQIGFRLRLGQQLLRRILLLLLRPDPELLVWITGSRWRQTFFCECCAARTCAPTS